MNPHPAHDKLIAIAKGWQMECDQDGWVACTAETALRLIGHHEAQYVRIAPGQPEVAEPIEMVLHCPKCRMQHVDAPEKSSDARPVLYADAWDNPPHRSHLCHGCGHIWRPADVPTNGVATVKTKGKADSPIAIPTHAAVAGKESGND